LDIDQHLGMPSQDLRALVESYLEPVLLRAGFAAGQWGDSPRGAGVIFCAAGDVYVRRHPQLVDDGSHWDDVYCVDLTIEGSVDRGIATFDVEFEPLVDLLARTGHGDDAAALPSLFQLSHPDRDLRCVADVLARLYRDAERPTPT
jgi:hypothetical protein